MTDERIKYHHDKFFKTMFSRKDFACGFIQNYFPSEVVQHLDLNRMEISKDSFIDSDLEEHFSDILYQVVLREEEKDKKKRGKKDKKTAYVYLLFDHKSYSDSLVSFQLLKYTIKIWDMLLKQRRADESQKGKWIRFAPIFPLVVYHGEDGWTASRKFIDLFDVPTSMERYIPNFEYWLCDLSDYSDEEIIGEALLQIGLRVLKYSRADDIVARMPEIFQLFHEITSKQTALEVLHSVLRYLSNSSEKLTKEHLTQLVEEMFEQGGETMATIAQQLRMEGEEIGLARGQEIGLARGREEAKKTREKAWRLAIKHVRQTLVIRFETKLDRYDKRLKKLKLPIMEKLNDLAFEVKTLAEFEVELTKLETSDG